MNDIELKKKMEEMMKRKLEKKEFEFKESYWQELEQMRSRSNKKRWLYYFLLPLLFAGLTAYSIHFVLKQKAEKTNARPGEIVNHDQQITLNEGAEGADTNPPSVGEANENGAEESAATVITPNEPAKTKPAEEVKAAKDPLPVKETKQTTTTVTQPKHDVNLPLKKHNQKKEYEGKTITLNEEAPEDESAQSTMQEEIPVTANVTDELGKEPGDNHKPVYLTFDLTLLPVKEITSIPVYIDLALCDTCHARSLYADQHHKKQLRRDWIAEGGVTLFNPGTGVVSVPNVTFGLRYVYHLSERIHLGTGLVYARMHQQLPELEFDRVTYSFGENRERTTLKTLRFDYAMVPVYVETSISKRQWITGGVSYAHLLTSATLITREQQDDVTGKTRTNGYPPGISRSDLLVNLGYRYQVRKWILSGMFNYGLFDITGNDVYHGTMSDRNIGLMITAGYKL